MSDGAESLVGREAPEALAKAVVRFDHGGRKTLGTFWASDPCFVSFLRHFACPACFEHVSHVLSDLSELRRLGVRVLLVGVGDPSRILPFKERARVRDADIEIATDPTLESHRAAGLVRSAWGTFGPRGVYEGIRLTVAGYGVPRDTADGDLTQQAGALLVDRGGRVALHHVSRFMADEVSVPEVVALARTLAPRATVRL